MTKRQSPPRKRAIAEKATAERDAAVAALGRVRALIETGSALMRLDMDDPAECSPVECVAVSDLERALDGA